MSNNFKLRNALKKSKRKNTALDFIGGELTNNPLLDNSENELRIKLLSKNAKVPTKGTEGSAGYDLYAAETKIVHPGKRVTISLDIALEMPRGTYGRLASRSGLSICRSIDIGAGVIDNDYRGTIKVVVINSGPLAFLVQTGKKIAQLIITEIRETEIKVKTKLTATDRDISGFGSTDRTTDHEMSSFGPTARYDI
ncbi:MAG: dUTP diphosphatase [Mesoflavibacter sp.]|nr:dUTP diphosphatase [Mesoflavibacter sp.]